MIALVMGGSVNSIASFALLAVVTYVGASAAVKVISTYVDKYKRKIKEGQSTNENHSKQLDIKHGLQLATSTLWSVGLGREFASDRCEVIPGDGLINSEEMTPKCLKTGEEINQNLAKKFSPEDVARKLVDELIKACTETINERARKEGGFIDGAELDKISSGDSRSATSSEDCSSDQTGSTTLTNVSSLVTCDSDSSSVASVTSTIGDKGAIVVDGERTISVPVSVADAARVNREAANSCLNELQEANTSTTDTVTEVCKQQSVVGQGKQGGACSMEPCALQQVSETFAYDPVTADKFDSNQSCDGGDMHCSGTNNARNSNGLEYDLQLMAMEEEMRRNEREIAEGNSATVTRDVEDGSAEADGSAFTCSSPIMAPILEEEEEESETGSYNAVNIEKPTDVVDTSSTDTPPTSDTIAKADTAVEGPSLETDSCVLTGSDDNGDVNMKCADCKAAIESDQPAVVSLSSNVVVTKADVHVDNVDAPRVRRFQCATCCSQSPGNGQCVTTCEESDGSDVKVGKTDESASVVAECDDSNRDESKTEQCAAYRDGAQVAQSEELSVESTPESQSPDLSEKPSLKDLHGTQNSIAHTKNEASQQDGHASTVFEPPRDPVTREEARDETTENKEANNTSLSESKTAEFPEPDTVTAKSKTKDESSECEQAVKTEACTKKSIEFFGVRPKGTTTPTECSISTQMRCVHTGSSSGDKMAVVEDGDLCDLEVFLKLMEGLAVAKSTKIYVKVTIEHDDPGYKRIKRKTQAFKCTSPAQLNKNIKLPNVRRKILTQGRLVVAVWSRSSLGSNSMLCKCEIDLGKQMKFFDGKGGVMTFAQKLAGDKKVWNDVNLYLS